MSYKVTEQRQKTMLARIGADAAALIDDQRFLPFYRGVQIRLEKMGKADEWQRIIETAKTKADPKKYFARLCKMVRNGTYQFTKAVKEVAAHTAAFITDKIQRFGFNQQYSAYWVRKVANYIDKNGMVGFVHLLEYADRKNISQQYFAAAILNGKTPAQHYKQNIMGAN